MINREKVIKGLERFKADFKPFCGNSSDWARVDDAINLLKEQEPVQCTDCKWWHESEMHKGYGDCGQANGITLKPHDWFCADGERKEGS